jgi:hypothetical protein
MSMGGTLSVTADVRAPIFYDSNDTGYYLDPNGNTRLNQLLLAGSIATINNFSPANSAIRLTPNLHLNATAGHAIIVNWDNGTTSGLTFRIGNGAGSDVFTTYANGAVYASIIYDISDSAYYIDPNSTSRLNNLQVGGTLSPDSAKLSAIRTNDGGTALYVGTGSQGVFIKNDPANATTVQYFSSGSSGGSHRFLSGNTPALFITGDYAEGAGSLRAPIFYDSNNTGYYFDGSATSRWTTSNQDGFHSFNNYGLGVVGLYASTRFQCVFAMGNDYKGNADGTSLSGAYGLWFSYPSAGGPAANLSTHGLMLIQNGAFMASLDPSMRAISDMRAPIFYDYNDTAYYLDPNTTSDVALRVRGGTLFGPNTSYGAYLRVGANNWTNDYSSVFVTNGNLHIDSQPGYDLYLNWYSARPVWSEGGAYFPIYYDRNNTAFYLDPASTSVLSTVRAAIIQHSSGNRAITLNGSTWTEFCDVNGATKLWLGGTGDPNNYYNANIHYFRNNGSGNTMTIDSSGNVVATANVTAYSDARLKKDVETIGDALGLVGKMRGVRYTRIDTEKRNVGVIAQEMLEVIPEVVHQGTGDDDTLSVAYGNLVGVLIEAIKELEARVAELEGK